METIIKEILEENECLIADGFDDAIIGFQQKDGDVIVVYSINKCIYSLMENDNMGYEEAEEFLHFNIINCYMGVKTPIFIKTYYNG
tara:strand:+ start:290 stop:547 length:258 start_codon:yes stop_codon:yes gene_type:complete